MTITLKHKVISCRFTQIGCTTVATEIKSCFYNVTMLNPQYFPYFVTIAVSSAVDHYRLMR